MMLYVGESHKRVLVLALEQLKDSTSDAFWFENGTMPDGMDSKVAKDLANELLKKLTGKLPA